MKLSRKHVLGLLRLYGHQARIAAHDREHVYQAFEIWLGLHILAVMISIDASQEIFAINVLTALKSSLGHRRKHILRSLRPYGDQAELGQGRKHAVDSV